MRRGWRGSITWGGQRMPLWGVSIWVETASEWQKARLGRSMGRAFQEWKCWWEKQWMQAREKVLLTYAEPLIQLCRKLSSSGLLSSVTYLTSLGSVKKILVSKCFRIDDFQSPLKHQTFCNTCGKLFTWSS